MIIERLEGYVTKIEGDTAFVTLKCYGGEYAGEYPTHKLEAAGIRENQRFHCDITENDEILQAIPLIDVSKEEQDEISARLRKII